MDDRFTGANDPVENYAELLQVFFEMMMFRNSIQLKTVVGLYNMEIHQKKAGPDYHRLKTMVKRSIEQDLRIWNIGARNGNYERNAVVENHGTKQRGQRIVGECWQWKRAVFQRRQLQFPSRYQ